MAQAPSAVSRETLVYHEGCLYTVGKQGHCTYGTNHNILELFYVALGKRVVYYCIALVVLQVAAE